MTTTKHPNRRMKATLATILTIAVLTGSNLASANNHTRCGKALHNAASKEHLCRHLLSEAQYKFKMIKAEKELLLTEYLALQKTHKELLHEFETLKGEVEPLRDAIRREVEEQIAAAEKLVSEVPEFMTQNPDLPELVTLFQLMRKLKASITQGEFELIENSYTELVAVLDDIPSYAVFREQRAEAERAAAELTRQKEEDKKRRQLEEYKLLEEKHQAALERDRLKEEEQRRAGAELKRKNEEAIMEKGKQLVVEMRHWLIKNMDADDIDQRLGDLAELEEAINSETFGKILEFVTKYVDADDIDQRLGELAVLDEVINSRNIEMIFAFGTRGEPV